MAVNEIIEGKIERKRLSSPMRPAPLFLGETRIVRMDGRNGRLVELSIVFFHCAKIGAGMEVMDRQTVENLLKKYTLYQHLSHLLSMEFPHKKLSIDIPYYSFKLSISLKTK